MKPEPVRDKHLRLNQRKINQAKVILHAKNETETIEKALDFVITEDANVTRRKNILHSILARRNRLSAAEGDVVDWVREGREERDKLYGR